MRCPFACKFLRLVVAFPAGVSCLRMFAFPESFSNVVHATDETARDNFDVSPLPVLEPTYFDFFIDRRPFAAAFRRLEASQASSLVLTGCELTSQHAISPQSARAHPFADLVLTRARLCALWYVSCQWLCRARAGSAQ